MNGRRIAALVAAALVLGLLVGSVSTGFAAPVRSAVGSATAGCAGLGLQLGATMRSGGARLADVVGKLTGTSADKVAAQRAEGKSFAQIAGAAGVSSANVVDEALKVRQQVLAGQVRAGTITQAQADSALASMKTRLTQRVQNAAPGCIGGGAGCGGAGRGAGRGGTGCAGGCFGSATQ